MTENRSERLKRFADFLTRVENRMHTTVLNDYIENQKLLIELPERLFSRRRRKFPRDMKRKEGCLKFKAFTNFINPEAEFMCNPIFSYHAVKEAEAASIKMHEVQISKEVGKQSVHPVKNIEENSKEPNEILKQQPYCASERRQITNWIQKFETKTLEKHYKFSWGKPALFWLFKSRPL